MTTLQLGRGPLVWMRQSPPVPPPPLVWLVLVWVRVRVRMQGFAARGERRQSQVG